MLTFPALTMAPDSVHLVVTAYNMLPYQDTLVVYDAPAPVVAGFIGLPERVVPGNSVAFADTSIGITTTWHWYFPGGTPEVSEEKDPVITYNTIGTYDVKLIVGDGFTVDSVLSTAYIVVDFPASTGEKSGSFSCSVQPNPCNGNFNLNIKSAQADLLGITVFDMIGKQVFNDQKIPVNGQISQAMNLSTLPDGIYFLKVAGDYGMTTCKIVIRK